MDNISKDPFVKSSNANAVPGLAPGSAALPNGQNTMADFSEYRYCVGFFQLGGESGLADQSRLEELFTKSLKPDGSTVIMSRKESISSSTGIYTVVVTYMERRANA